MRPGRASWRPVYIRLAWAVGSRTWMRHRGPFPRNLRLPGARFCRTSESGCGVLNLEQVYARHGQIHSRIAAAIAGEKTARFAPKLVEVAVPHSTGVAFRKCAVAFKVW